MTDSPFPGMDPYLEERSLWGGVQTRLMTAIADDLAERLAPHFFVGLEERVYVVGDGQARPLQPVERRERYVEVRDPASRRVITTIEVLSPVNKAPAMRAVSGSWASGRR